MTLELKWLAFSCLFTALLWMPYGLKRIPVLGLKETLGYSKNLQPMPDWAERLKKAHYNSIENLVVFGLLVLITHNANIHSNLTVLACQIYFWSRLVYVLVYTAGIPAVRTLAYAVSWICILSLAGTVLL